MDDTLLVTNRAQTLVIQRLQINIWTKLDGKIVCSLPSLGGFVYSVDISLLDPSSIAFGVGDNMIRIWEASSAKEEYSLATIWRGIGSKVMKVLWHPVEEGLLAFGTEEGKVGLYNVMSQKSNSSRTYHKKSVYSLSWGPPCGSSDNRSVDGRVWHLYSCGGEGTVFVHKPESLHEEAKSVDKLIKTTNNIKHNLAGHSEISWKPDRSLAAIGNEDGSIHLYRAPNFKMLSTVNVHSKSITCLAWYYSHAENELDCSFFASSSNGFHIHIHDLRNIVEATDGPTVEATVVTSSYQRLVGHGNRVTDVAWSPHSPSRLASSSYDGTVQIWDVSKGEPLANYRGHSGRVMSVAWSVLDSDVIFSGSEDFTLRCWRISQQFFKEPPADVANSFTKLPKSKGKKKKKKSDSVEQNVQENKSEGDPVMTVDQEGQPYDVETPDPYEKPEESDKHQDDVISELERAVDQPGRPIGVSLEFLNSDLEGHHVGIYDTAAVTKEPSSNFKGDPRKRKKKGRSLFPLSASADNRSGTITSQECVEIARYLKLSSDERRTDKITKKRVNLGLYTDRESVFDMLTEEGIHHSQSGNIDHQLQLEVWKGNIAKALEIAIEKRELNDWLIGISHLAGEQVQLAVTEAFAEQLASEGCYHKAALYYMACHKIHEAVRMLHSNGMYREALVLAKVRLLPSDPILLDIYSSWARKLENECSYHHAAKCYLACGLHDDATRVLSRRSDEASLFTAAQVAKLTDQMDLSESLILKCALSATRDAKWKDAYNMVSDYANMQPFLMQMFTHQVLVISLSRSGVVKSNAFPEMEGNVDVPRVKVSSELPPFLLHLKAQYAERRISHPTCHWGGSSAGDVYFVCSILEAWYSYCRLNVDEKRLHGFFVQISAFGLGQITTTKESFTYILLNISRDVCLGLIAAVVGQHDVCAEYLLKALLKCHNCGNWKLLRSLFILLFPFGLESWHMINGLYQSRSHKSSRGNIDQAFSSLAAFYYQALLNEALADCDAATKQRLQSFNTDASIQPSTDHKQVTDSLTSNSGDSERQREDPFSSNKCDSLDSENICEKTCDVRIGSDSTGSHSWSDHPFASHNVKQKSFCDLYQIALVSSTILLSNVHARTQNAHGNLSSVQVEAKVSGTAEYQQMTHASDKGQESEILLTKYRFPDVMNAARTIVDLCVSVSNVCSTKERDDFKQLARQVAKWTFLYSCNADHKRYFEAALEKLNI